MIYEHQNIVVGSSLEAVNFAFKHNYPILFTEPQKPFRFDYLSPDVDISSLKIQNEKMVLESFGEKLHVGISKTLLWERMIFLLSLDSKVPLSNLSHSLRCIDDRIICSNEYAKIAEFRFENCYFFNDPNSSGFVSQKKLADEIYLCYDWIAFNRGGKHNVDYIKTKDKLANEIWFYPSDRIDGNTAVKDACVVSTLTKEQLNSFDYSETMLRFKLINEMESRGMKGKFNGYGTNGKPKYYKFRTTSIARQTSRQSHFFKPKSENIKIPKIDEKDMLEGLQESALGYDRFLRFL